MPQPSTQSSSTRQTAQASSSDSRVRIPSDHAKYEVVLTAGLQSVRRAMERRRKKA
jgi:hypothetical protein